MARELPPLFKTTERVIREIEEAVRRFPRFHKYSIGQRLRDQAYTVLELLHLAWRDRSQQLQHVRQLVLAVDVLKSTLQVAMQLGAVASTGQFEAVFRVIQELGRQSGGWLRRLRSDGQNVGSTPSTEQRALILSSRDASQGAHP